MRCDTDIDFACHTTPTNLSVSILYHRDCQLDQGSIPGSPEDVADTLPLGQEALCMKRVVGAARPVSRFQSPYGHAVVHVFVSFCFGFGVILFYFFLVWVGFFAYVCVLFWFDLLRFGLASFGLVCFFLLGRGEGLCLYLLPPSPPPLRSLSLSFFLHPSVLLTTCFPFSLHV